MLCRSERLTSREFERAFSSSRSFRDARLTLRVHWRARGERAGQVGARSELRAAFVVPKKLGKAVWRNRARRRLQEAFRLQREALQPLAVQALGGASGCDCIFIAGPAAHGAEFEELQSSIRLLLSRASQERRRHSAARAPASATRAGGEASGA